MKGSNRSNHTLKDFRLLFRPRTIIFFKKNSLNLKIYLEKDVQVIGAVQEFIPPLAPNINYTFSEFNQPIEFRMVNEKPASYIVSLYEVQPQGTEKLLESSQLKFSKFLQEYYKEFLTLSELLLSELKAKEGSSLPHIWKDLRSNFTKKTYTSGVRFPNIQGILQFIIEPVHQYDEQVQEIELKEQKKREKKEKPDEMLKKANAIPDYLPMDQQNAYLRRVTNDSDLTQLSPFDFDSKKVQTNKLQSKENIKPNHITITQKGKFNVLSNIAEASQAAQSYSDSKKEVLVQSNQNYVQSQQIDQAIEPKQSEE